MTRIAICLIGALAVSACASGPRDGGPGGAGQRSAAGMTLNPAGLMIAGCDTDGDYRVTPAELEAGIARSFAAADADGSGRVDGGELSAWRALAFGDSLALPGPFAFDADQNGAVTPREFAAAIQRTAEDYADPDGTIPFAALAQPADRFARNGGRETAQQDRGMPGERRGQGDEPF